MGKGETTRNTVLDRAITMASQYGLEALTIGVLARETGLSKSGLFAHFASKENLQLAVLEKARERFIKTVIEPALRAPRGEPRLRALFDRWLIWEQQTLMPGGCVFINVASELGDRPGPVRDLLVTAQHELLGSLARSARIAVEEHHFREDLDAEQFAYELYGMILAHHLYRHVLDDPNSETRLRLSFHRLLEDARRPQA